MTALVIYGVDFLAKQMAEKAQLLALSQAMAPDEVFYDPDFVEEILRVQKLPPERTFRNSHDAIAWLNAPDKDSA